ncbi:siderophore-interacting protein [Sanguibacter sp. 25GB23B1]|uniref:siderophore-interacting protein n=1 Tax=Sanguibacter sp. 25GB23B1 TaxID=3156067 RepID=UPI0032AE8204
MVRTERIAEHMVRLVLAGDGLALLDPTGFTDRYVKLQFAPEIEGQRERLRTYTVRRWDSARGEITLDFVVHGDEGIAGPWAARAQPGDEISFLGPGGAYAPAVDADWYLFIGDESALPAIAAALEVLPEAARAKVFVEVGTTSDEMPLATVAAPVEGDLVTWVHRDAAEPGITPSLVEVVCSWDLPPGTPDVFLHGDAGFVRDLRRYLRLEHAVPAARMSASGYWRRGRTEETWRSEKREWNAAVEADEAGSAG